MTGRLVQFPTWSGAAAARDAVSVAETDRTAAALVVDHPLRDLPGLALVAGDLARRHGTALLVPMYRQGLLTEWARPRALVVNYARPANLQARRMAHTVGVPVLVLDTEGAPYMALDVVAKGIAEDQGFGDLSSYLFWSTEMRDAVRRNWRRDTGPRFVITGHPRFDFLEEPLRTGVLGARAARPTILIVTSFSTLNSFAHLTAAHEVLAIWRAFGRPDYDCLDFITQNAVRLVFVLRMVPALAAAHPSARIVIRPHPFEGRELYETAFAGMSNVAIEHEGTSLNAVAGAHVVLHCRSSVGFEARALGIAAGSLVPDRTPQIFPVDRTSAELHTVQEAVDFVGRVLSGQSVDLPAVPVADIEFALGVHRGSAAKRVADAVDDVADASVQAGSLRWLPSRRWWRQWEASLRGRWVADEREKQKAFNAGSVQAVLDRCNAALGAKPVVARNVIGRAFLDPPVAHGAAPLAVEVRPGP